MSKNDIRNRVYQFGQRLVDKAQDQYYSDTAARLDTIIGAEKSYALRLRAAKAEWDEYFKQARGIEVFMSFPEYLKEYYGIKMHMTADGLDLSYDIVDEQKHTIFLLKFSG